MFPCSGIDLVQLGDSVPESVLEGFELPKWMNRDSSFTRIFSRLDRSSE